MAFVPADPKITAVDGDCALWVLDAVDGLRRHIRAMDVAFDPASAREKHVRQMVLDLSAGRVGACVDLLSRYQAREQDRQGALQRVLVPAIHSLEAAWKQRTMELGALILAFGTARHVIDVWRHAADRRVPQGAGRSVPLLVAVAPNDHHAFGAQILADDLFMRGFEVTLLTETSSDGLAQTVAEREFAAILLSFGYDGAFDGAADLIARLRAQSRAAGVTILAGGRGFSAPLAQYAFLGADAVLQSAQHAATYIETIVGPAANRTRN